MHLYVNFYQQIYQTNNKQHFVNLLCGSFSSAVILVEMMMMYILLHLTKLPTQYQSVSIVCHVC